MYLLLVSSHKYDMNSGNGLMYMYLLILYFLCFSSLLIFYSIPFHEW